MNRASVINPILFQCRLFTTPALIASNQIVSNVRNNIKILLYTLLRDKPKKPIIHITSIQSILFQIARRVAPVPESALLNVETQLLAQNIRSFSKTIANLNKVIPKILFTTYQIWVNFHFIFTANQSINSWWWRQRRTITNYLWLIKRRFTSTFC